ncbi:MAG TPA: A/G-specific adenine glycosylase [Casimicrobiaceae bacterium]|nr:A/G-specific adenine glycosylase [Casimicrobiaceae bacterium]
MISFAARVVAWQRMHGRRDLPWQQAPDPYRIWLSEIMLQQTQVATVLPYFVRFVAAFPDVAALASAPLARVLEHWSGLGYYRRAHHLHAAARIVVERHDGRFPSDSATLATLPGIGRSTAAAIAAFSGGERAAILDGNVKRVLARHGGVDGWPGAPKVEARLWEIASSRLPNLDGEGDACGTMTAYTQGLMDLGATVCTRNRPRCDACPVGDDCVAHREQRSDVLPACRPRKLLPKREINVLLLEHDGRLLFERRPLLGVWPGLWGFPEFDVNDDLSERACARFGIVANECVPMPVLRHVFTHFALTMHPMRIRLEAPPAQAHADDLTWLSIDEARSAAVPAPVRRMLDSISRPL